MKLYSGPEVLVQASLSPAYRKFQAPWNVVPCYFDPVGCLMWVDQEQTSPVGGLLTRFLTDHNRCYYFLDEYEAEQKTKTEKTIDIEKVKRLLSELSEEIGG